MKHWLKCNPLGQGVLSIYALKKGLFLPRKCSDGIVSFLKGSHREILFSFYSLTKMFVVVSELSLIFPAIARPNFERYLVEHNNELTDSRKWWSK
jgi:hypothetical protein